MASSTPERHTDAGFATAMAMAVSLSISIGVSALLVRIEGDLIAERRALERTAAEYRLDAVQRLAALAMRSDLDGPRQRQVEFDGMVAKVRIEVEREKLASRNAAALPESWLRELGVRDPAAVKAAMAALPSGGALGLQSLAALSDSPLWKACAADALSTNGAPPGAVAANSVGATTKVQLPQVVRLTVSTADGWREDRVVRLSQDNANPAVVLDRMIARARSAVPSCPPLPAIRSAA
jgi:hypothetical protein